MMLLISCARQMENPTPYDLIYIYIYIVFKAFNLKQAPVMPLRSMLERPVLQ